jgi:O-antigen/teichoic acid export membrane protein
MDWSKITNISGLKDITTLSGANIIATIIGGIFWFYIASLVGEKGYGEISYYLSIATIGSVITMVGASNSLVVYAAKGEKILPMISFIALILSAIAAFIIFLIFFNMGASLHLFTYVIFGLITAEIIGKKLYKLYSMYIISQKILMVIFAISLYYFIGDDGVLIGISFSFLLLVIPLYNECKKSKMDFGILKPKRNFIINNYVLDISRTFGWSLDKIIIVPMFGFVILGNYQLGLQFYTVFLLFPSIIYQYILPQDASGVPNVLLKKITIMGSVGTAILGIVFSPIFVPIVFPEFHEAVIIIQIMSLGVIPGTINYMYISKFLGELRGKIVLLGSGIYLGTIILGIIILGRIFDVNGLAMAFVLAGTIESIFLIGVSKLEKRKRFDEDGS